MRCGGGDLMQRKCAGPIWARSGPDLGSGGPRPWRARHTVEQPAVASWRWGLRSSRMVLMAARRLTLARLLWWLLARWCCSVGQEAGLADGR